MPVSILVHEKDELACDYRDKQRKAKIVGIEEDLNILFLQYKRNSP